MVFNDVITFSDVNLKDCVRDLLYNQCIPNKREFSIFFLTLDRIRITSRISLSGVQEFVQSSPLRVVVLNTNITDILKTCM